MATQSRSPVLSAAPTFDQTFTRLVLWVSPFIVLFLALAFILAILAGPWGGVLILTLTGLGLWALLRMLGGWIREVPHLSAIILSRRDNHRLEALRVGFYLRPDVLYKQLAQVSLRPSEGEKTVEHVALRGGPPLTIRIAYTLRPNLPPLVNILPRGRQGEDVHDRDMHTIGFLLLAHNLPERWATVSGNVIDREVRAFLSGLAITDIYDPAGPQLGYAEVIRLLNAHLAATVEPELGFHAQVHTLEVRDGNTQATLEWRRRLMQMQQLAGWTGTLAPEQLLLLLSTFGRVNGDPGAAGIDPLYLILLILGGQAGPSRGNAPGPFGPGLSLPPFGPVPIRPGGPNRPAA